MNICVKIVTDGQTYVYAYRVIVDRLTVLSLSNVNQMVKLTQRITMKFQMQHSNNETEIVPLPFFRFFSNPLSNAIVELCQ